MARSREITTYNYRTVACPLCGAEAFDMLGQRLGQFYVAAW